MTIEEKAKAYDEALKVLHKYDGAHIMFTQDLKEEMFPELKESEDERIRKNLLGYIKGISKNEVYKETKDSWIAWLEKQGEQKKSYDTCDSSMMDNKKFPYSEKRDFGYFEEKFKEGDWVIIDGETLHIINVTKNGYSTEEGGYIPFRYEKDARLWTIQDAKDGDVLVTQKTNVTYESIFIFKKIKNNRIIQYLHYFTTDAGEEVCEARSIDGFLGFVGTTVHPATKEQRDTLMKAMTDAGYTFDFEKKELKKIEQDTDDIQEVDFFDDFRNSDVEVDSNEDGLIAETMKYKSEQKPTWSEEDEKKIDSIIETIRIRKFEHPQLTPVYEGDISWLKSLKDRVQPQHEWKQGNRNDLTDFENAMMHIGNSFFGQYAGLDPNDTNAIKEQANLLLGLVQSKEWSEEDEKEVAVLEAYICSKDWSESHIDRALGIVDELVNKVKSLRPQKTISDDIEYVRKDAFIEKVCKYLQENCTYTHPRKGTPTCAVNLTLLKEYLEDEV